MRFIVTTHDRLDGVFLSRPGHFGNLPFPNDAAAVAAAQVVAGPIPIAVTRDRVRLRTIPR